MQHVKKAQPKARHAKKAAQKKAPKHAKAAPHHAAVATRSFATTTPAKKTVASVFAAPQAKSFMTAPKFNKTSIFQAANTPFVAPAVQFLQQQKQQKRNMAMMTGQYLKVLVPCDPRFPDDEVISVLNQKTGLIEPVCFILMISTLIDGFDAPDVSWVKDSDYT